MQNAPDKTLIDQLRARMALVISLVTVTVGAIGACVGFIVAYVSPAGPEWIPASRYYFHAYIDATNRIERLDSRIALNEGLVRKPDLTDQERAQLETTISEQRAERDALARLYQID